VPYWQYTLWGGYGKAAVLAAFAQEWLGGVSAYVTAMLALPARRYMAFRDQ